MKRKSLDFDRIGKRWKWFLFSAVLFTVVELTFVGFGKSKWEEAFAILMSMYALYFITSHYCLYHAIRRIQELSTPVKDDPKRYFEEFSKEEQGCQDDHSPSAR